MDSDEFDFRPAVNYSDLNIKLIHRRIALPWLTGGMPSRG